LNPFIQDAYASLSGGPFPKEKKQKRESWMKN
jgi:hypothetical protein